MVKLLQYIRQYGLLNSTWKAVYIFANKINFLAYWLRRAWFYFRTNCKVQHLGKGVILKGFINNMTIGMHSNIYDYAIFELSDHAHLHIGRHFTMSYGSLIACHHEIIIGDYVMIGEYSSVRDRSHNYVNRQLPFASQGNSHASIRIGNNVWVGRGCIILPGTVIEDNVVIGANSVVKGKLFSNHIYAGAPAKMVKRIEENESLPS